jgi:Flp pilus assembly CpaF family ATPase
MSNSPVKNFLKPIQRYLDNDDYIELICLKLGEILAETKTGKWKRHSVPELDQVYWAKLAHGLGITTGQRYTDRNPMMRGAIPGGHRLFLLSGPNVIDPRNGGPGLCATIRLKRNYAATLEAFNTDNEAESIIKIGVSSKRNILVAGGMGSGKTTLTQVLCNMIKDPRPVSIEDSAELKLTQPAATQFLVSAIDSDTDITNRDMVSALQRTRADRFVLGEVTMENAFIMMRILNMGVPGMIGTIHCDFAKDAIDSVTELMIMSGYAKEETSTATYLNRKIDLVIFVERAGAARVVSEIYAPNSEDNGKVLWRRG